MEVPVELLGKVISCWMTVQRFAAQFDLPDVSLECFERVIAAPTPCALLVKLHTTFLQRLMDAKQVVNHTHVDVNEVTWSHHLGLLIRQSENLSAASTPVSRQCDTLGELLRHVYPNRQKKPEYYVGQALGDLVRIAEQLEEGQPLDSEDFSNQVLEALAPVNHTNSAGVLPTDRFHALCEDSEEPSRAECALSPTIDALLTMDYARVEIKHRIVALEWLCCEVNRNCRSA